MQSLGGALAMPGYAEALTLSARGVAVNVDPSPANLRATFPQLIQSVANTTANATPSLAMGDRGFDQTYRSYYTDGFVAAFSLGRSSPDANTFYSTAEGTRSVSARFNYDPTWAEVMATLSDGLAGVTSLANPQAMRREFVSPEIRALTADQLRLPPPNLQLNDTSYDIQRDEDGTLQFATTWEGGRLATTQTVRYEEDGTVEDLGFVIAFDGDVADTTVILDEGELRDATVVGDVATLYLGAAGALTLSDAALTVALGGVVLGTFGAGATVTLDGSVLDASGQAGAGGWTDMRFDLGGASWRTYTEAFDGTGFLTSATTVEDDGSSTQTFYGGAGDDWSSFVTYRDASGALTGSLSAYKDGSCSTVNYDLLGASWASYEESFDAAGQLTDTLTVNDDGSSSTTAYDLAGQYWSTYTQNITAGGALASTSSVNDDGSSNSTAFDLGGSYWFSYTQNFDAMGALVSASSVNDNGSTTWTTFDPYDLLAMASSTTGYTATGQPDWQWQPGDDGTAQSVDWDATDDFSWSVSSAVIAASGAVDSSGIVFDDGSSWQTDYDLPGAGQPLGATDYSISTTSYTPAGEPDDLFGSYDDGSSFFFDLNGDDFLLFSAGSGEGGDGARPGKAGASDRGAAEAALVAERAKALGGIGGLVPDWPLAA